MIDWEFKNDRKVLEYMRNLPEDLVPAVRSAIGVAILKLQRRVLSKLDGSVLKTKTGALQDAIKRGTGMEQSGSTITGYVGLRGASAKTAIAGASQEFGADIPAHIVQAVNVSKLRFTVNGKFVFAKFVKMPQVKIPERSFLRSAMDELHDELAADINAAAQPSINLWRALF